ncbi:fasciclin domain-containing protein [Spirosoma pollinicola]|uniref:Beta-Ig-H3/fasciclin n=1 Tax=Spirosoma pollinicola TaxID=2057025 RepID=A0A2K8Z3G0_9BACT|nr:fasciclin domain-containing protein [Spirosoma pollinicola]AUD04405.1 beta-Ig-H3/fasciclin [Spirosoma pollinicola]
MLTTQNAFSARKWSLVVALLISLTFAFTACKKADNTTPTLSTIGDLVNTGSKFTLLKAALVRAGLDGTLAQPGTYTVFAPTDDAFKAFGYVDEAAIKAAPVDLLKTVLQYHVLGTRVAAADVPTAINTAQQTLAGMPVYVSKVASGTGTSTTISVNGAHILQADGQASNGVIHAIDRVLLPPVFGNIVQTIQGIPLLLPTASFKLLQAAVTKAGVGAALTAPGPLTVFAPTDAAFKAVGIDSAAIANTPVATLTSILTYHVLNGRTYTPTITNGSSLSTLQGGTITAGISTTALTVTGTGNKGTASNITGPDVSATNGVVHIIDRLLLPQ